MLDVTARAATAPLQRPKLGLHEAEALCLEVDAELAALLESEASGAETSARPTPAGATPVPSSDEPVRGASGADDIPWAAVPGMTAASGGPSPTGTYASGGYLSILSDRPLPATKRFGAIILDAPLRSSGAELAAGLLDPRGSPPGPGKEGDASGPLPAVVIRTEDQKSSVIKRLDLVRDPTWERKFHAEIDRLYKEISEEFSTPPDIAQKLLEMLREARQLMLDTPEEFGNAEYRVMQVATAVERRRQSRQQARFLGPWLFFYLAIWLLAMTAGLVFANQITNFVRVWGQITGQQLENLSPILNTMLWGGIGGVVGGLYALWYHIADRQDFDKHYSMWYYVQPLMGLVLGAITFLILAGGFLIVQVNIADPNAAAGARVIPYLVAVLAGFKQDFVYDQLERVVSIFAPGAAKPDASSTK